jgi:predicted lactoylglutathione lyase
MQLIVNYSEKDTSMKTATTYLHFDGNCRQAMTFYQQCFRAQLQLNTYPDATGQPSTDPDARIMHGQLLLGGRSALRNAHRSIRHPMDDQLHLASAKELTEHVGRPSENDVHQLVRTRSHALDGLLPHTWLSVRSRFTDERAACMIVNEHAPAILLTEAFLRTFTNREFCNRRSHRRYGFLLSRGGRRERQLPTNLGFMYGRSFYDLDGHQWEAI